MTSLTKNKAKSKFSTFLLNSTQNLSNRNVVSVVKTYSTFASDYGKESFITYKKNFYLNQPVNRQNDSMVIWGGWTSSQIRLHWMLHFTLKLLSRLIEDCKSVLPSGFHSSSTVQWLIRQSWFRTFLPPTAVNFLPPTAVNSLTKLTRP